MKKKLLKNVYAFIVTLMMFSVSANAQIIYTDVNPDLTITQNSAGSTSHNLDINNDGITDATMTASLTSSSNKAVKVSPSAGSQVPMYGAILLAKALNYNAIIGTVSPSGTSWQNAQNAVLRQIPLSNSGCPRGCSGGGNPIPFGDWSDSTDRYLPIRFSVGGDWYYGWVRVSVVSLNPGISFTIKDYAYNSLPNQQILAGETSALGMIENFNASLINLSPNPATNHLTIALGTETTKVQVSIADMTGKVIYRTTATDTQKVDINTSDLQEGIYIVQIQAEDVIVKKKLVVKK